MTFVWVVPCRVARCALNWLIDRLARETGFRLCGGRLGSVWDGSVWCAFWVGIVWLGHGLGHGSGWVALVTWFDG